MRTETLEGGVVVRGTEKALAGWATTRWGDDAPGQQSPNPRPVIRCGLNKRLRCGQSGLMRLRLLLTQHLFALADSVLWRSGEGRQCGHSRARNFLKIKPHFSSGGD